MSLSLAHVSVFFSFLCLDPIEYRMIVELPDGWKPIDDGKSDISGLDKRIKFADDDSKINVGGFSGMDHLDDSLDSEAAQHLIGAGRGKTLPPNFP